MKDEASAAVDGEEIRQHFGGDAALLRELIELFVADCPRLWQNVRAALSQGDAGRLARAAHALKGSIGVFGVRAAHAAAERVEQAAGSGDLKGAAEAAAQLEAELERLKQILLSLSEPAA